LTITNAQVAEMGFYTVTVTSSAGSVDSRAAILTVNTGGTSRLGNVSTRGLVRAGDTLTPGFVIRGAGTKSLLIRAIGPTLGTFGLTGALEDPQMDVIRLGESTALLSNNDWGGGVALQAAFAAVGAFPLPPSGSKDSASLLSLGPSDNPAYTVRIAATDSAASGIALAEVYDADPRTAPVRLVNVSTRGFVGTGADALTPGFYIDGTGPKLILVRVVGPGLSPFGVTNVLEDPQLTLIPLGHGFSIAANNDWSDGGQFVALDTAFKAAGAFSLRDGSKDAALTLRLPPGGYTVQATGVGNTTGTALVEVYDLDP
jgi:hypothetical protein